MLFHMLLRRVRGWLWDTREEWQCLAIDWTTIKQEYITTAVSQRALAKKYGVSPRQVAYRSKAEEWFRMKLNISAQAEALRDGRGGMARGCEDGAGVWADSLGAGNVEALGAANGGYAGSAEALKAADGRCSGNAEVLKAADGRCVGGAEVLKAADGGCAGGAEALKATDGGCAGGAEALKATDGGCAGSVETLKAADGGCAGGAEALKAADGGCAGGADALKAADGGSAGSAEALKAADGRCTGGAEVLKAADGRCTGSADVPGVGRLDAGGKVRRASRSGKGRLESVPTDERGAGGGFSPSGGAGSIRILAEKLCAKTGIAIDNLGGSEIDPHKLR